MITKYQTPWLKAHSQLYKVFYALKDGKLIATLEVPMARIKGNLAIARTFDESGNVLTTQSKAVA